MILILLVSLICFTAFALISWNLLRARSRYQFSLAKNCLLTRNPLVFVTGRPSLFYFGRYWNFIPTLLEEHGYEVMELNLGWMSAKKRRRSLESFLDLAEGSDLAFHAVFDNTVMDEALWLSEKGVDAVKSSSLVVSEKKRELLPQKVLSHSNLQVVPITGSARGDASEVSMPAIAQSYLQWAINLAEKDHLQKPT